MSRNEYILFFSLFILGMLLSLIHTAFAALTVGLWAVIAFHPCNWISKMVFHKQLEIPSKTEVQQSLTWSDWLLLIPFTALWILPLFAVGEAMDCYTGSDVWEHLYGFCE